jgi:hypothetical protein
MSDAQLKPCPFCGGDAKLKTREELAYIQCVNVEIHRAMFVDGADDAKAIAAWNTRTDLSQAAVAAALERAADAILDKIEGYRLARRQGLRGRVAISEAIATQNQYAIRDLIEPTGRAALDSVVAERTKELEAKLAKAVEALEKVACGGAVPDMQIAAAALAELKGEPK